MIIRIILTISLLFFISCENLFPPDVGCCISWNENSMYWPKINNPYCQDVLPVDDCESSNYDNNSFYIDESCTQVSSNCN